GQDRAGTSTRARAYLSRRRFSNALCLAPAFASAPQMCSTHALAVAGCQPSPVTSTIASSAAELADIHAPPLLPPLPSLPLPAPPSPVSGSSAPGVRSAP